LNVDTDVVSEYYLQGRLELVVVGGDKLLVRLMMEGRCVANVVGAKEMAVYVCWGGCWRMGRMG